VRELREQGKSAPDIHFALLAEGFSESDIEEALWGTGHDPYLRWVKWIGTVLVVALALVTAYLALGSDPCGIERDERFPNPLTSPPEMKRLRIDAEERVGSGCRVTVTRETTSGPDTGERETLIAAGASATDLAVRERELGTARVETARCVLDAAEMESLKTSTPEDAWRLVDEARCPVRTSG
jgi:hypothetical protein